jgi:hypothetical protein
LSPHVTVSPEPKLDVDRNIVDDDDLMVRPDRATEPVPHGEEPAHDAPSANQVQKTS